jgi:hypothetical protein
MAEFITIFLGNHFETIINVFYYPSIWPKFHLFIGVSEANREKIGPYSWNMKDFPKFSNVVK